MPQTEVPRHFSVTMSASLQPEGEQFMEQPYPKHKPEAHKKLVAVLRQPITFLHEESAMRDTSARQLPKVKIYCPRCGKKQLLSYYCVSCRVAFAGYFTLDPEKSGHREERGNGDEGTGSAPRKRSFRLLSPFLARLARLKSKPLRYRGIAASMAFLILFGSIILIRQNHVSSERRYLHNYVLALYGIRSGMELSSSICGSYTNTGNKDASPGLSLDGKINPEKKSDLDTIKHEVDSIMEEMGPPPEKLSGAAETLRKLCAVYKKQDVLANGPSGSVALYEREVDASRENFVRLLEDLKANLPGPLADELKKDGKKYDLRFITS